MFEGIPRKLVKVVLFSQNILFPLLLDESRQSQFNLDALLVMFNLYHICLLRAFEHIHMEFARYKCLLFLFFLKAGSLYLVNADC